jgi:phosphoglycerate dehydrogenase-like enzyme
MIVLVPVGVHIDLEPLVSAATPDVRLVPYDEDVSLPVADADRAEVVFRWVAGKRYESLTLDGRKVRYLHTASAGIDHVLTPRLRAEKPDLILTDSGPAFTISLSEYVVGWMLLVAHRFPQVLAQQRAREWRWVTDQEELYGQTVGIIGLGPIGQGIAARCKALGMRTVGLRRTDGPVAGVDVVHTGAAGRDALLDESDWIVIAAALTEETRALIGRAEIARLKPTARIVNVARGALIDEPALIDALRAGRIAGACLDVFATEPLPADSPLWDLPNVWVSPHTSPGWSMGLRRRQITIFVENLRRYVAGEPLEGVVDKARGY